MGEQTAARGNIRRSVSGLQKPVQNVNHVCPSYCCMQGYRSVRDVVFGSVGTE
jgi:hypothetical protein